MLKLVPQSCYVCSFSEIVFYESGFFSLYIFQCRNFIATVWATESTFILHCLLKEGNLGFFIFLLMAPVLVSLNKIQRFTTFPSNCIKEKRKRDS